MEKNKKDIIETNKEVNIMDIKETVREEIRKAKGRNQWLEFKQTFHQFPIKKSGRNNFSKYDYYLLEDIERVLVLAEIKTGYTLTLFNQRPKFINDKEFWTFSYEFLTPGGRKEFNFTYLPETTQKNAIQASGAISTYGHRYSLMRLLGIAETNDDPDSKDNTQSEPKKVKKIKEKDTVVVNEANAEKPKTAKPKTDLIKENDIDLSELEV